MPDSRESRGTAVLSLYAFFTRVITGLASYILFAVAARLTGPGEFGVFSAAFSAALVVGTVGSFGQQIFLVKEVPLARESMTEGAVKAVYSFSAVTTISAALVTSSIFLLAQQFLFEETRASAIAAACVALLYSLSQTTMGVLRVEGRTLFAMITRDLLWRILSIAIIFLLYGIFQKGLDSDVILFSMAGALLFVLASHLTYFARSSKGLKWIKSSPAKTLSWLEASCGLTLVALISSADLYLYTIFLGGLVDASTTGAFFAALKTAELLNLFLMAVTLIVAPDVSRAIARKDASNLQRICNVAMFLQLVPVSVAASFVLVAAPALMGMFHPSYAEFADLLRLLALGMIINALTGATVLMLQVGGFHWRQVFYQGGALAISLALLPVLVDIFGANGAAYAFISSKVLWNVLAIRTIRKHLGVDPSVFGFLRERANYGSEVIRYIKKLAQAHKSR